jgi:glycine cleavage system aminomethyltransferase T
VKEWRNKANEDFRYAQTGQEIEIEVRDKEIAARIVELPFYRKK